MQKYKLCPYCSKHNDPKLLECDECGEDLSSVALTDDETEEKRIIDRKAENGVNTTKMVRICEECGAKNPPNANICVSCGEDISMVLREKDIQENKLRFVLISLDGNYEYKLINDSIVIGREKEMKEYLLSKPFVSRVHATLSVIEGNLYVENVSKTNYTFVNNVKVMDGEQKELNDGDELQLGGNSINGDRQELAAYFQVRIGACI